MDRIGSDESSVEGAGGSVEARWRLTWPRTLLAATLPPLGALSAQLLVGMASARWSLFYPAIFISAWLGGFRSGVGATVLSSALVWWYVILPSRYLHAHLARQGVLTAVFALMGILVSVLQERLRRASRNSAAALHATQRTNEQLQKVLKERGAFAALIANSSDFIGMTD